MVVTCLYVQAECDEQEKVRRHASQNDFFFLLLLGSHAGSKRGRREPVVGGAQAHDARSATAPVLPETPLGSIRAVVDPDAPGPGSNSPAGHPESRGDAPQGHFLAPLGARDDCPFSSACGSVNLPVVELASGCPGEV